MILVILALLIIYIYHKTHTYIIENGNIIFKNLTNNYNLESLMKDLIKNKITDISNIEKAYLFLGNLVIKENRPLVLIANGKIDYNELVKSKKCLEFIYKSLKMKKIKLKDVLYAIYLNDRFYIVKI